MLQAQAAVTAANLGPSQGRSSLPTELPSAAVQAVPASQSSAPAGSTAAVYQDMKQLWENCSRIKATAIDLLSEGRNAAARKKWVDYYLSLLQEDLAGLKTASANLVIPANEAAAVDSQWKASQESIGKLSDLVAVLATELQKVKSPTDETYPPQFWKPASEVSQAAEKLDSSLLTIFSALDAGQDQSSPAASAAIAKLTSQVHADAANRTAPLKGYAKAVAAETGIKHLDEASKRVAKACWGLFGELERWNLLYGQPPAGGIGDMLYGGGLTKQELYSQYKYLPQFTFTNAPYVMLYSYRLPPRQNMLAYHTTQIGKLLNLMDSDMNDLQIPADRQLALSGPWENAKEIFVDCRTKYLALYNAVNTTNNERLKKNIREDQVTLGQPVMAIYADMAKLRDALADIDKLLN